MVKIGVVGAGYWGPNLIRNLHESKECELSAVCDLDEAKLKEIKEKYNVETTTNYDELLKKVDAVFVAVNPSKHFELAKKSLKEGKHVFVEKPLAMNSKEATDLIKIAEEKKLVLMVGHTFEYVPAVNKLKEMVENNEIGKLHYVYSQRLNLGLWQPDCNVVWDLAPHDISLIMYVMNDVPVSVNATGKAHVEKNKEDVAFITLNFANSKIAHLHVSWLDPVKTRKTVVVGDRKMVVFDDINQKNKLKVYEKKVTQQKYGSFEEFHTAYKHGKEEEIDIEEAEPLRIEVEHFIDCIKKNKKPRSDGQDGLNVIKVIEAIQKSMKNNGEKVEV